MLAPKSDWLRALRRAPGPVSCQTGSSAQEDSDRDTHIHKRRKSNIHVVYSMVSISSSSPSSSSSTSLLCSHLRSCTTQSYDEAISRTAVSTSSPPTRYWYVCLYCYLLFLPFLILPAVFSSPQNKNVCAVP